jgi:alkylation response protein AidB-like acyl-CoA dehydrogenase
MLMDKTTGPIEKTPSTDTPNRLSGFDGSSMIWPSTGKLLADEILVDIARKAAEADERGALSAETVARLRDAGYFGLPIPNQLNGGGASLLECAALQRRLAMADPALAIGVNMHLFAVGMAREHWQLRRDSCGLVLEAIATQKLIVAAAFAEPGLGSTLARANAKARRTQGGYVVQGVKSPCSLAAQCDLVCFQMEADPPEADGLMTAIIPAKTPGIHVEQTWDALGMRGSGSDTLRFEECFVPDQLVFHRSGQSCHDQDEILAAGLVWFCVTATATYLGVLRAAVDFACEQLHASGPSASGTTRAQLASVQSEVGKVMSAEHTLAAACAGIADRLHLGNHKPSHLAPFAFAIKDVGVDACVRGVESLAELVGGATYARTGTLARLWRDVQAAHFHSPARAATRQFLGQQALGLPVSFVF